MPHRFGAAFLWEEKAKYNSVFRRFLFLTFPDPHSLLRTGAQGLWVYTHTHVCELTAFCSLPQVSALSSAGGVENLILLEQEKQRPHEVGSVQWAGGTFGPMRKSRLGEHDFEALMRMLDNLVSLLPLSFETSPLWLSPPKTSQYEALSRCENCQHHNSVVKAP